MCADQPGAGGPDRPLFNGLAEATARAAQTTGSPLGGVARGRSAHGCSPTPWVTGFTPPVPYHPSEAENRRVG